MKVLFNASEFPFFDPGQHFDVRLTAEDGYQAQRSYSVASAPSQHEYLEFGIDVLPDGEVSGFLSTLKPGDRFEIRGPIGRHFIWKPGTEDLTILMGGGSGVVPFLSMIRESAALGSKDKITFINSFRTVADIAWGKELEFLAASNANLNIHTAITKEDPGSDKYYSGRLDRDALGEILKNHNLESATIYICGSNAFVETVSKAMLELGATFNKIKTERYG